MRWMVQKSCYHQLKTVVNILNIPLFIGFEHVSTIRLVMQELGHFKGWFTLLSFHWSRRGRSLQFCRGKYWFWLVVEPSTPLKNDGVSSSVGNFMIHEIPNCFWKFIKILSKPPTSLIKHMFVSQEKNIAKKSSSSRVVI